MFQINKQQKDFLTQALPDVRVTITNKQSSRSGKKTFYVESTSAVCRALDEFAATKANVVQTYGLCE